MSWLTTNEVCLPVLVVILTPGLFAPWHRMLRWVGSKGVVTPAHYDEMHNVFLQLHGSFVGGATVQRVSAKHAQGGEITAVLHRSCGRVVVVVVVVVEGQQIHD